jgi:guanylate kinase
MKGKHNSAEASAKPAGPLLIVLSAPSGGGKTTLCHQLLAHQPELARAVTCTTRAPRAGELEGVDYYFLDCAAFAQRVAAGWFLEHATVYGNHYGTLKSEVLETLRQGRDVMLSLDVQGVATVQARAGQDPELQRALVTVFLAPPSLAALEKRLRNRGLDAPAEIEKRLRVARHELAQAPTFDYVIVSDTVAEDLRRMRAIVVAEKMRPSRAALPEY